MNEPTPSSPASKATSHSIVVDGRRVHYHEAGSGPPVLLLHGGGPGASGWSNFNRNLGVLATRFRTIVPDAPGFGRSEWRDLSAGLFTTMADALRGLLDALDIRRAHLVGNSMGGGAAIRFAMQEPARVGKLVLMAPGGLLAPFGVMPSEGLKVLFNFYAQQPTAERLMSFLSCMVFDSKSLTPELVAERLQSAADPAVLANPPFRPGAPPPVEELWRDPRFAQLQHEIMFVWGRDDRTLPLDCAFTALKQLPNSQLHVFSRCGHWVQWERPAAFNRLVMDFLGDGGGLS
jgi:2-hydroxy-6-oxonona-2,4-dienedioate hydrolase/4,5:9,10-diseco-3-hydroxy-5,9,17-trioxoandrosta-1(10),2-diene-4-oate hydrolase